MTTNRLTETPVSNIAATILQSSMSQIGLGTILRSWRGSKGLDYVIVGANAARKVIYCIKANCINDDGTVHASVTRYKRSFSYDSTSATTGIVKGITSVMGQKRTINQQALNTFHASTGQGVNLTDLTSVKLYTHSSNDRRNSSIYS